LLGRQWIFNDDWLFIPVDWPIEPAEQSRGGEPGYDEPAAANGTAGLLQVTAKRFHAGISICGFCCHGSQDGLDQLPIGTTATKQALIEFTPAGTAQCFVMATGGKRRLASQQVIDCRAQAKDIGGRPDRFTIPTGLFGRHVGNRSGNRFGTCPDRIKVLQVGQAKVDQVWSTRFIEHDVVWVDITMDHTLLVGGCQCVGDLAGNLDAPICFQRVISAAGGEVLSFDQVHHQEGLLLMKPEVVDANQVRMPQ